MIKLDLKKDLKDLYNPPSKEVVVVNVPRFKFVQIDGEIEPGFGPGDSPGFGEAMQALYGVAYTLKFNAKLRQQNPVDYSVMALEGLWWTETGAYNVTHPEGWKYNLMILQPGLVSAEMFAEALAQLRKKRPSPALERLRLEEFEEGLCVQIMHIGPYASEPATIAKMDAYAAAHGYRMHGKHHEIYMSDPRRTQPEKLRTILRHPVKV